MKTIGAARFLIRLLVPLLLILLLPLYPRPWAVEKSYHQVGLADEASMPMEKAHGLEQIALHQPWMSDLWEESGLQALEGGEAYGAIDSFQTASKEGVLSDEGLIALGDAYQKTGDIEKAAAAWLQAAGGPLPASEKAYERLLDWRLSEKDYVSAVSDLKNLIQLRPTDGALYYQAGLILAATQPDSAQAFLEQAATLDASYSSTSQRLTQSIKTARLRDEPAYTFLSIGRVLASMGEWPLAAEAFKNAVTIRPDYAEAWAFLAEAQQRVQLSEEKTDADEQSLAYLEQALVLDPQSIAVHSLLALYWQRQGEFMKAIEYLESAAELDPENPVFLAEIGNNQAALGDLPAAQAAYQQAIALDARNPLYWRVLAQFSLQHQIQLHDLALPAARQAVILDSTDPANLDLMGLTLYYLGDHPSAERFLMRALQVNYEYVPALLHLGLNDLAMNQLESAQEYLTRVTVIAPNSPEAKQALHVLELYFSD